MTTVTLTASGQLPLSPAALQHLGIPPGARVELAPLPDGRLLLKPVAAPAKNASSASKKGIESFIGRFAGRIKKPLTISDMNNTIAAGWAGELDPAWK